MKKLLFILMSISLFACSKEESNDDEKTSQDNQDEKVEISLKRPTNKDCNLMSLTQTNPGTLTNKTEEDSTFTIEYNGGENITIKLKNEEATLVSYSKNSKQKSLKRYFQSPNYIWINESWYPVTTIGNNEYFFESGTLTSDIEVAEGVKTINNKAFGGLSELSTISLPSTLEKLCDNVFEGCNKLLYIKLPHSLNEISQHTFDGCNQEIIIVTTNQEIKEQFENLNVKVESQEVTKPGEIVEETQDPENPENPNNPQESQEQHENQDIQEDNSCKQIVITPNGLTEGKIKVDQTFTLNVAIEPSSCTDEITYQIYQMDKNDSLSLQEEGDYQGDKRYKAVSQGKAIIVVTCGSKYNYIEIEVE